MTVPMLRSLLLKRFRSFPSEEVEFDNPTFLVGQNGSGKSNFADAFAFLSEAMASPLQAVLDRRGGIAAVGTVRKRKTTEGRPASLGLRVELEGLDEKTSAASYAFELHALDNYGFKVEREQCIVRRRDGSCNWFDRSRGKFHSNARFLEPSLEASALALPLVGGSARFQAVLRFLAEMQVYRIEPAALREMQDPDGGVRLRSDGSNAASVLREIKRKSPDDWERVVELLESIVPKTVSVQPKKHGNKLTLEFTQEWTKSKRVKFEAFHMSDGTLRALGILAAVFQQPVPSVLVVEEPESTMHPGALNAILDVLRHAGRSMQVVVTTHSPDILDAKWIEDRHLKIVSWEKGATRVDPVSEATRTALRERLMGAGELLRANALAAAERPVGGQSHVVLFEEISREHPTGRGRTR